jgi:hypothetical protein
MTARVHLGELAAESAGQAPRPPGSVTAINGFQVAKQAWHREF